MIDKIFKYLKIGYASTIAVVIVCFVLTFLYVEKWAISNSHPALESWAIIITLGGIFGSLKYLHPKVKVSDKVDIKIRIKTYLYKYLLRLLALLAIYAFNLSCYIYTGSRNFIYLAFILIFTLFLCTPNKGQTEGEPREIDNTSTDKEIKK